MTTIELDPTGGAVVDGMPHDEYLRHPALSASGAKVLVRPGGPARFAYERVHGAAPKRAFDVGHAVHAAVLGVDPGTTVVHTTPKDGTPVPALDYKTRSAQEHRDAIRAAGRVPVLASDLVLADDMAAALRRHPLASRLLHADTGRPEVSLFWHDGEHDVDRRGRVDWLRHADDSGRLILCDYKTASSADPDSFARAVWQYGYAMQASWYRDLVIGLGLASSAPFVFVVQETTAPYLVHCIELDEATLQIGAERNQRALRLFRECTATGVWPGYNDAGITLLSAPTWAHYLHADESSSW